MEFYLPTKLFYNIDEFSKELDKLGKKFLIITGKSSKFNGSLDELVNILNKTSKIFEIFDESKENPPKELIEKILERYGKDWDVIVGLGGGSPMDTAKAVAVLCKNNISVEELYNPEKYNSAAKIICIPTTAGTGSEVTQYSVLTINGSKKGFKHELIFPKLSLLEPKFLLTLPKELTISTGLDALSHAIESALSLSGNNFSELFAFKAIEIIKETLPKLLNDLENYELRKNMLLASTYAGIAISVTGTTIAHSLGYPLTTEKGIHHGIATAVFLPFEIENANNKNSKKVEEILGDMLDFLKNLNVQISFEVSEKEISKWADIVSNSSHVKKTPGNYNYEKIKQAYYWLIEKSGIYRS
jgi:alcohol dehydrogenase class IV